MKRTALALAAGLAITLCAPAARADSTGSMMMRSSAMSAPMPVTPANIKWEASPMLPPGGKMAVLQGNPNKPGMYTVRALFPNGSLAPVHFHGGAEYLTVLQGTFMLGYGDRIDAAKTIALPAGSFIAIPAGTHHYAMAKGDTIVQVSGIGPFTMTAVKTDHM